MAHPMNKALFRWVEDQFAMQPVLNGHPAYSYADELRKVATTHSSVTRQPLPSALVYMRARSLDPRSRVAVSSSGTTLQELPCMRWLSDIMRSSQ